MSKDDYFTIRKILLWVRNTNLTLNWRIKQENYLLNFKKSWYLIAFLLLSNR